MTGIRRFAAILVILLSAMHNGVAQAPATPAATPLAAPQGALPAKVKVGIFVSPPFVMKTDAGYGGHAIELWEEIASKLGVEFEYRQIDKVPELLHAVAVGDVDILVSNLTITHARLQQMDFTQPWFDAGLRLMINENKSTGVMELLGKLRDSGYLRVYAWIGIVILVCTIGLTLIDRIFDPDFPRAWHKGIAESFYHVMSVATSGKAPHKELFGAFGRILAAIWMVAGVAVVAYVTSSVTSVMTVSTLTSQVRSLNDLSGKTVGVLRGTTSESYAIDAALSVQSFDTLQASVDALVQKQIAAIIGDAPVLEYYDNNHPELPITEVGAIFSPEKYGFALPIGSPLVRLVTQQIVAARESGYLERLRLKYFGNTP